MQFSALLLALTAGASLAQARFIWIPGQGDLRNTSKSLEDDFNNRVSMRPWDVINAIKADERMQKNGSASRANNTSILKTHTNNSVDIRHPPHGDNGTKSENLLEHLHFFRHDEEKTSSFANALGTVFDSYGIPRLDSYMNRFERKHFPAGNSTVQSQKHARTLEMIGLYSEALMASKQDAVVALKKKHKDTGRLAARVPETCNEFCGTRCVAANIIPVFGYLECLKNCHAETNCGGFAG